MIAGSVTSADAVRFAVAWRHCAELVQSIRAFEQALDVSAADPGWRDRVGACLRGLREAFSEHVTVTEGSDGLYTEILNHAPRLAHGVRVLVREHIAVAAAMEALQARLEQAVPFDQVRACSSDLVRKLARHRQRGADLVYEAYETDIGGET